RTVCLGLTAFYVARYAGFWGFLLKPYPQLALWATLLPPASLAVISTFLRQTRFTEFRESAATESELPGFGAPPILILLHKRDIVTTRIFIDENAYWPVFSGSKDHGRGRLRSMFFLQICRYKTSLWLLGFE